MLSSIVMVKILNISFLNFFVIKLICLRENTILVWCFSICELNMSSIGPILEPKIQPLIHLGLSWHKSLILRSDRFFFYSTELFSKNNIS